MIKKLIFSMMLTSSLMADYYTDYMDSLLSNYNKDFTEYNKAVVKTSSAMIALSSIDFFKHEGLSAGVGVGTVHSEYGNADAYALGVQYGMGDVMFNVKGAYKDDNEYIISYGLVVGFW